MQTNSQTKKQKQKNINLNFYVQSVFPLREMHPGEILLLLFCAVWYGNEIVSFMQQCICSGGKNSTYNWHDGSWTTVVRRGGVHEEQLIDIFVIPILANLDSTDIFKNSI